MIAVARRQWRDTAFLLPAVVVVTGVLAQVVANQGARQDVLMLWLVPLYALAAWATVQVASLPRDILGRRAVTAAVVVLVAVFGSVDLVRAVRATPENQRLSEQWHAARTGAPVTYLADVDPLDSDNRFTSPATRRMTGDQRCGTSARSFAPGGASATRPRAAGSLEGGPRLVRGTGREASPRIVARLARRGPVNSPPRSAPGLEPTVRQLAASLREAELVDTAERLERAFDREARIVALDVAY